MRSGLLMLLCAWLGACSTAQFEDVSKDPKYADVLGQKYVTLDELMVHGVNYDRTPGKVVQQYVITNKPGFGGRGVVSGAVLKAGVTIEVHGVLRCTNCWYEGIEYVVTVDPPFPDLSIPVHLHGIGDGKVALEDGGKVRMNPSMFAKQ